MIEQTIEKFHLAFEPADIPKHVKEKYIRPEKEKELSYVEKQRIRNTAIDEGERPFPEAAAGATEDELWFRHHNWKEKRALVRQALVDAGTGTQSVFNYDNCGAEACVEWSEQLKKYRVRASYCHNRHCEPCMKAKSALVINNLRTILKTRAKFQARFITLTLKHDRDTPLRDQIKRLYTAYKKLRATKLWKKTQKGGAATLEVKWVPEGTYTNKQGKEYFSKGGWHPHLHIISEGQPINTYTLSDLWHECTGDSFIVDVRFISADKDVAYYVGKYVTKGTNDLVWSDPARAAEWIAAVKGVRMCATFGTWRGFKLLAKQKEDTTWKPIASLTTLVRRANTGNVAALDMLRAITEQLSYDPNRRRKTTQ